MTKTAIKHPSSDAIAVFRYVHPSNGDAMFLTPKGSKLYDEGKGPLTTVYDSVSVSHDGKGIDTCVLQ